MGPHAWGKALFLGLALVASPGRAESPDSPVDLGGEYRTSVLDGLRRTRGFLPADMKAVWSRFLDQVEKARGGLAAPAGAAKASATNVPGDLGDGFLAAFGSERGLGKKLDALAGYRITLGRAQRWAASLDPKHQEALAGGLQALLDEAGAAEGILLRQLGDDLARGGKGLEFVKDYAARAGLAGPTAKDAFASLTRGLKQELTRLASGGALREEQREDAAGRLTELETLIAGE